MHVPWLSIAPPGTYQVHDEALEQLGQAAAEREAAEGALMAELIQLREEALPQRTDDGRSLLARELAAALKEKDRMASSCEVPAGLLSWFMKVTCRSYCPYI